MRPQAPRSRRWIPAGAIALFAVLGSPAAQQRPERAEQAKPAEQPAAAEQKTDEPKPAEPKKVRVLEVGTVHPVSGPAIENGVIVIEGDRIVAVGARGDVEIPAGADVLSYPNAHAYPGLVDALSTAFGDAAAIDDRSSDAGTEIMGALDPYDPTSRSLVDWGVTTAYVSNRGATTWRGMGALVHPRKDGFEPLPEPSAAAAAVELRVSGGTESTHPLARQKALRSVGSSFAQLDSYEKKKKEHEEALAKYAEDYEKYLDYYRKKKGGGAGEEEQSAERAERPDGDGNGEQRSRRSRFGRGTGRRGGRRGPPPGERPPGEENRGGSEQGAQQKPETPGEAKPEAAASARPGNEGEKKDEAPKKPTYPKAPPPNPANDALLEIRAGALPLRVEACQADEIRAALHMRRERDIPQMVLEVATDAGELAPELATAGIPVIATGLLDAPADPERPAPAALPAKLAEAGVVVAIGSGSVRQARYLPLMAAAACGRGLDPDTAVAAITLTPAKVLGVASQVGSLEAGKRADVIVTDAPLLASDSRILAVLSGGETQFKTQKK